MIHCIKITLASILGIALIGCSNLTLLPFNSDGKITHAMQMHKWQLMGKVAIIQGQTSDTANFHWVQNYDDFKIVFSHTLGFGKATLTNNILTLPDGSTVSNSPQINQDLPMANLKYWILGLADPRYPINNKVTKNNRIISLQQEDWHISYASYQPHHSVYLPSKITLAKQNLKIKIVITNWYQ